MQHYRVDIGQQTATAQARSRMHEHDRIALAEILRHRLVCTITQPFVIVTCHMSDAIDLQYIKRILDLAQAALSVGERYYCKYAEPPPMRSGEIGGEFVHSTRPLRGHLGVTEPHTGRSKG